MEIRILIGGGVESLFNLKADADDEVAAVVDHGLDVRDEVRVGGGFGGVDRDAELLLGGGQAVVGGFVEGLIVPATSVGNGAGLERGAFAGGGARFGGGLGAGRAAG
ncbi:Uncharacterised protein [Chlamydia trachomatis]|nr:Uncharacterised protein [Chlamydia trachomatis]